MRFVWFLTASAVATSALLSAPQRRPPSPSPSALRAESDKSSTTNDRRGALIGGLLGGWGLFELSGGAKAVKDAVVGESTPSSPPKK